MMKIGERIINDIRLLMNFNRVLLWGVMLIVLIRGILMGGDGIIKTNSIFS